MNGETIKDVRTIKTPLFGHELIIVCVDDTDWTGTFSSLDDEGIVIWYNEYYLFIPHPNIKEIVDRGIPNHDD